MSTSINSDDYIDAVTEGINRVGIDSEIHKCANCGKEGSEVSNTCNKCKSVMYCNAACKKKHRKKHKKACERRVTELHDEKLFKQPPPLEDCPICFLRMPSLESGQIYMACCGKVICSGCIHAVQSRATKKEHNICPFCRTPNPTTNEEVIKQFEKRIELNDATAICDMGCKYAEGLLGLPQNRAKALELWHRAAELGDADAYCNLGIAYDNGDGVQRDETKAAYYYELAAIRGDSYARANLGVESLEKGDKDRALKHWMITVKDGEYRSLQNIKCIYMDGHVTKDDYAKALRSYRAYLDEIKSDQRDEAAAANDRHRYYESVLM